MCLVSARLESGCDFPFFVLFNIKPYLLYWELQRLLSNDMRFSQAHIKFPYKILPSACLIFFFCLSNFTVKVLRNDDAFNPHSRQHLFAINKSSKFEMDDENSE